MSDADDNVIEQLEARRKRARREPPPRRPARGAPTPPSLAGADASEDAIGGDGAAGPRRPTAKRAKQETEPTAKRSAPVDEAAAASPSRLAPVPDSSSEQTVPPMRLSPDDPITNYAVRVRRSLDDLVAWRLAELRRQGVRTTKVELTEMLLWELSPATAQDLEQRLVEFRRYAPR
jgi:hypothetical protein